MSDFNAYNNNNNHFYVYKLNHMQISKDAWMIAKFISDDIHDFTQDLRRALTCFGKSLRTRLKLSSKGLSCEGGLGKVLDPSWTNPNENFELSRICDIYQDRNYLNVLICVVKSKLMDVNLETYAYKLEQPRDVVEFQDLFTELVTGAPTFLRADRNQLNYYLTDARGRRPESIYAPRGYPRHGTLRHLSFQPRNRYSNNYPYNTHANDHEYNAHANPSPLDRGGRRLVRLRDVGVQVDRGRWNFNDELELFFQSTKVYSLNNAVLSDVSCMVCPSSCYNDEGQAVVLTGNSRSQPNQRFATSDDIYLEKRYSPPLRNENGTYARGLSRGKRESQYRSMNVSDGGSSDEIRVRLSGDYNQGYMDYSTLRDMKYFRHQGMNGYLY